VPDKSLLAAGSRERLPWSNRSWRRILVDTQISDWDPGFLSRLTPESLVEAVACSGAEAAMVYFQSHTGLCNWPTASGATHGAFAGSDFLAKTVDLLHASGLPVCAYYSVQFNNWAYLNHPDWRVVQSTRNSMGSLPMPRYGLCCAGNPGYRAFVIAQTREILAGYDVDAIFFDMMWQPGICGCTHCRTRCEAETGAPFPEVIDWFDTRWCAFQAARERWTTAWAGELRETVRTFDPSLEVYHNFAMGMANWSRAQSFASAQAHDFLGGDFYGGRDEQLVVCRLLRNLSAKQPIEFMTSISTNLTDHETLKHQEELDLLAFAATAHGAAFLAIAAWDPDGSINPAALERIRASFEQTRLYEPFLGGSPVEDVGIYYSSESKVNFAENGTPLADLATSGAANYPHFHAVRGACRALQAAHIPFGILTRRQLGELDRYRVLVLPNVLRMDAEECAALRTYVERGGRLYASRLTSLTESRGVRREDFALSDVFGMRFITEERGRMVYVEPATDDVARAIAPQRRVAHAIDRNALTGAVRVEATGGQVLARLTLPYGHPHEGSVDDQHWSSIHSWPPDQHLEAATIVRHAFGTGTAIYAAIDLEAGAGAGQSLFVALVRDLLGAAPPQIEADAPACVWLTAFNQPERRRMVASLLNYPIESPVIPIGSIRIHVRHPLGARIRRVTLAPDHEPLEFESTPAGVSATLPHLGMFAMLVIEYAAEREETSNAQRT
jgi:hypothetical protein